MTTATEKREEIAIGELDQRYGSLRLASPQELGRVRSSIERMGVLSPVLVATAVEAERLVLVDGFKRVRVVMDRGGDRKSTRLNSSHIQKSRMPSSA